MRERQHLSALPLIHPGPIVLDSKVKLAGRAPCAYGRTVGGHDAGADKMRRNDCEGHRATHVKTTSSEAKGASPEAKEQEESGVVERTIVPSEPLCGRSKHRMRDGPTWSGLCTSARRGLRARP